MSKIKVHTLIIFLLFVVTKEPNNNEKKDAPNKDQELHKLFFLSFLSSMC